MKVSEAADRQQTTCFSEFLGMCRYNTTTPTQYDQVRPTLLNPPKETASISDSESLPSPCTSPPQARRHYGESITNLGKASIMGRHKGGDADAEEAESVQKNESHLSSRVLTVHLS